MVGHDDDLMLRLNAENCPKFGKALVENEHYIHDLTKDYEKNFYPKLAKLIDRENVTRAEAIDLCEYIQWADLHEVALSVSVS
jgi:hypothetical protein